MAELLDHIHELSTFDFLNRLRGHEVTLLLKNGSSVTGKIGDGMDYTSALSKLVHVSNLEGREYFDAVVEKDSIKGFIFRRPGT